MYTKAQIIMNNLLIKEAQVKKDMPVKLQKPANYDAPSKLPAGAQNLPLLTKDSLKYKPQPIPTEIPKKPIKPTLL